jgi:cytochrome c5
MDALHHSALPGQGAMPARGGTADDVAVKAATDLSLMILTMSMAANDDAIKAATDYMVNNSVRK